MMAAAEKRRRRRDIPEIEGVPVEHGVGPARDDTTPDDASHPMLESLPAPYLSTAEGDLTPREHEIRKLCEAAIANLATAFWAAGKALQVIRDAGLYRNTHGTFEEYVADEWEMSRPQAYRLIDAWPLAEALSPMGDKINERQIRALLPIADRHGREAAVTVYRTVAETDGVRVTAKVIEGAIGVLPDGDHFDAETAITQIRAYLTGHQTPPVSPTPSPAQVWAAEAHRVRSALRRIRRDAVRAAAIENPDEAHRLATELREIADELENTE